MNKRAKQNEFCPCGKNNLDGKYNPKTKFCFSCVKYVDANNKNENWKPVENKPEKPLQFVFKDIFTKSNTNYNTNRFTRFLGLVYPDLGETDFRDFCIGTAKYGNTVFWYVDFLQRIRTCKVVSYLPNGKRDKEKNPFTPKEYVTDKGFKPCFFNEFQLSLPENEGKSVIFVESEKTAILCEIYYPERIWLAAGGKSGFTREKLEPIVHLLKTRKLFASGDDDPIQPNYLAEKAELEGEKFNLKIHSLPIDTEGTGRDYADYLLETDDRLKDTPFNSLYEFAEAKLNPQNPLNHWNIYPESILPF